MNILPLGMIETCRLKRAGSFVGHLKYASDLKNHSDNNIQTIFILEFKLFRRLVVKMELPCIQFPFKRLELASKV